MPTHNQGPSQLQDVLGVLRRRGWQIALPALVVLALGISAAKLAPRQYRTTTGLELREVTLPIGGEGFDARTLQRDLPSTNWQIKQMERVRRVVERLEWPDYTSLSPARQHDYLRRMIDRLNVNLANVSRNMQGSSLIEISYVDSDPQRAEQFLNRLREAYTTEVLERYRNDAKNSLDVLQNAREVAYNNFVAREREAAEVKKRHNISATQQAPGGGRQRDEDPVFVRLSAADLQLDRVSAQIAADRAALTLLTAQHDATPREISSELLSGGLSFDKELATIATEIEDLREIQKGLRPMNSVWQDAEFKIQKLIDKREALKAKATQPSAQATLVANPRRDQLLVEMQNKELDIKKAEALRAQLDKDAALLREKHAERVEVFREIQRLDQEARVASDNYLAAYNAFNRQKRFVDLITQGYSNPFEVTQLARTPLRPTSPNQPLIVGGALVLGLGLGVLFAFAAEYGRNGFRGVADISRALSVPVLGVINRIVTARQRAAARTRQALVWVSTAALVVAILWTTWAYENRPRLLGPQLTQAIEGLREMFR